MLVEVAVHGAVVVVITVVVVEVVVMVMEIVRLMIIIVTVIPFLIYRLNQLVEIPNVSLIDFASQTTVALLIQNL